MLDLLKKIRRGMRRVSRIPRKTLANWKFINTYRRLRNQRKILYALTPPAHLKNVGDHAQVVAIDAWLKKHFPDLPVIQVDKDESRKFLSALKWLIQPNDIIFLHSGGNLGDRGKWSESVRRLIISAFPGNQIISLPQTIYFSDTPDGREEQETTCRIYAEHPNLTVIGRDPQSGELASKMFPAAKTFCMPDFVLSLPARQLVDRKTPPKILLCLRLDDESALSADQRREIGEHLPYECSYFDTTLTTPITAEERTNVLNRTLDLFSNADVIVTDRYHGLIFTVLCQKPCIVLSTVDHKLTSAMHWFKDVPFITFARNLDEIPSLVERSLAIESRQTPDWNIEYFDRIPTLVDLQLDKELIKV